MIFRQIKKVVSACLFLLISIPVNAETIHIVPGPYGGSKIITPWGDYVAVPFGNTIWVGTVEEWMDIKADSVMRENGAKRVTLPGDKRMSVATLIAKQNPFLLEKQNCIVLPRTSSLV